MFTIKAIHSETVSFGADSTAVRDFFTDVKNFIELMPNIESIRTDNRGITHWQLSTHIPLVGVFSERFQIVQSEDSDERVEWSPSSSEKFNLMRFAADFLPKSATETLVRISQNIELRRNSPTDFHLLAGFAGESLISNEMTRRVSGMMKAFLEKAKARLESDQLKAA